jgi:hypothetical protein
MSDQVFLGRPQVSLKYFARAATHQQQVRNRIKQTWRREGRLSFGRAKHAGAGFD